MNITITLAQIRAARPCASGWTKLLNSLGGVHAPLETIVSLGDVARSNGAADAWWCVRCLDWADVPVRRAVIGALLPAIRRATAHTEDPGVHGCIDALTAWQAGNDCVNVWAAAGGERAAQCADLIAAFPPLHGNRVNQRACGDAP